MQSAQKQEAPQTPDTFKQDVETAAAMALPAGAPPPADDDLPEELRSQLIGYSEIKLEHQLIDCVGAIGGFATVDKIIVALWRRHERKDLERMKIIRTLNNLAKDGRVAKQNSPRGYGLPPATANG